MGKSARENRNINLALAQVKMRFVYRNGLKGEWVNAFEAYRNGFIVSHESHDVNRVEFEMEDQTNG